MGFVQGEGRTQGTLFPVTLEELIPQDHVCRVIDAFVDRLDMAGLEFERAEAAETGRPGYDPRALLKLYLYGYLQQIRSSWRLESECRRNIELMWLLGRLAPDHKTIAEFRRMHRAGVTAAGAKLVRLARSVGLVKGEWIAIDGSKFQAVSSAKSVRAREALEHYLEQLEQSDEQDEVVIDPSAVASALEKLRQHPEPEVGFMRTAHGLIPAYNVQAAVDAKHALIVVQQVTDHAADNRSLQPMAEAAQAVVGGSGQPINGVAYFRIYDLRSTYPTRLSAGGVADEWVTQLLRQSDSKVFKKYSQMKLRIQREALEKMNCLANEMTAEVTTAVQESKSLCTVPAQF